MTDTARFQEDDRVERWCMNLPDKETSKPRAISYSKPSRPDRKPTSSPASRVSASSTNLQSQSKSEGTVKRTSTAKSQSQSRPRLRSAPGSSLASGLSTSRSASVSSLQPTPRRSSSSGSISIASSLIQGDYEPAGKRARWTRRLRPVLPGEAQAEDGTFIIDEKTEHWQGLRRKEQARIDQEDDRDLEKNLEKYVWAWKDTQARLYAIAQIREDIEESDCSGIKPAVMDKLVNSLHIAMKAARYALNGAMISQTEDGKEFCISGFYTDFLPSYWLAVAASERLKGMWGRLRGQMTAQRPRAKMTPSSRRRMRSAHRAGPHKLQKSTALHPSCATAAS